MLKWGSHNIIAREENIRKNGDRDVNSKGYIIDMVTPTLYNTYHHVSEKVRLKVRVDSKWPDFLPKKKEPDLLINEVHCQHYHNASHNDSSKRANYKSSLFCATMCDWASSLSQSLCSKEHAVLPTSYIPTISLTLYLSIITVSPYTYIII